MLMLQQNFKLLQLRALKLLSNSKVKHYRDAVIILDIIFNTNKPIAIFMSRL